MASDVGILRRSTVNIPVDVLGHRRFGLLSSRDIQAILGIVASDSCPLATYRPSLAIKKGRGFITCGLFGKLLKILN